MQGDRVTLGDKQRAGIKHEIGVAASLDQGWEQRGLPGDGALPLGQVAQVVGVAGQVVGQVHTQLQADGLTVSWSHRQRETFPCQTQTLLEAKLDVHSV